MGRQLLAIQRLQRDLVCMVNDIIEELLDLDMEVKLESLWWTNTCKDEDAATPRVGSRGISWDLPFREVFDPHGCPFHRDGKGFQGADRTMCKGMGCWWRDRHIHSSKSVSMQAKCRRVFSHLYSTALNGSTNWPWSDTMLDKARAWEPNSFVLLTVFGCVLVKAG